jgi:hypothetical protein
MVITGIKFVICNIYCILYGYLTTRAPIGWNLCSLIERHTVDIICARSDQKNWNLRSLFLQYSLPACFITERSTVEAVLFVKYYEIHKTIYVGSYNVIEAISTDQSRTWFTVRIRVDNYPSFLFVYTGVFGAGKSYLLAVTILYLVKLFQSSRHNEEWVGYTYYILAS